MISAEKLVQQFPSLLITSSTFADGNLGKTSLVNADEVIKSREGFLQRIGITADQVTQVIVSHNAKIKIVTDYQATIGDVDAIISNQPNQFFSMLTADCIPLFLFDPQHRVFALAHIGWRSLVRHLIPKTVRLMQQYFQTNPADLVVYAGPAICPECYHQTGFKAWLKAGLFYLTSNSRSVYNHFNFDIKTATRNQLIRLGLASRQIELAPYCTVERKDLFPSHFREGPARQLSIMTIVGVREL
jgi:polyphenol oxidase